MTDPQNLGAVIRSAAAFGANGVILPERRSASVNAAAWKVSAGAAAHMPVARVVNLTKALEGLKERGYYVVGLDGGGDKLVRARLALNPTARCSARFGRQRFGPTGARNLRRDCRHPDQLVC